MRSPVFIEAGGWRVEAHMPILMHARVLPSGTVNDPLNGVQVVGTLTDEIVAFAFTASFHSPSFHAKSEMLARISRSALSSTLKSYVMPPFTAMPRALPSEEPASAVALHVT